MYLWKCWRDTRMKVFVFLGLLLLLELAMLFSSNGGNRLMSAVEMRDLLLRVLVSTSSVILLMGWMLGDDNVGADIDRGSGDFLLTRPSSRGTFVWTGWMVGLVESIVLWVLLSATLFGDMFFKFRQYGYTTPFLVSSVSGVFKLSLPTLLVILLVNLALVYGLTYCVGVITRSGSRALIVSAALIFGYQILKAIVQFKLQISLPEFLLPYHILDHALKVPVIHAFVVRGCLALAFPALAHFVLERMEI